MERSSQARAKIDHVKKLKRLNTRSVVVLRSGVAWMRKMNVVTWLVFVTVLLYRRYSGSRLLHKLLASAYYG